MLLLKKLNGSYVSKAEDEFPSPASETWGNISYTVWKDQKEIEM